MLQMTASDTVPLPKEISDALEWLCVNHTMYSQVSQRFDRIICLDIEFINFRQNNKLVVLPSEYAEIRFVRNKDNRKVWDFEATEYNVLDWRSHLKKLPNKQFDSIRLPILTKDESHIGVTDKTGIAIWELYKKYKKTTTAVQYRTFVKSTDKLFNVWKYYYKDPTIGSHLISIDKFVKKKSNEFAKGLVIHKGKNDIQTLNKINVSLPYTFDMAYLNPTFSKCIDSAKLEASYSALKPYLKKINWKRFEAIVRQHFPELNRPHHPLYDAFMTVGVTVALLSSGLKAFVDLMKK